MSHRVIVARQRAQRLTHRTSWSGPSPSENGFLCYPWAIVKWNLPLIWGENATSVLSARGVHWSRGRDVGGGDWGPVFGSRRCGAGGEGNGYAHQGHQRQWLLPPCREPHTWSECRAEEDQCYRWDRGAAARGRRLRWHQPEQDTSVCSTGCF